MRKLIIIGPQINEKYPNTYGGTTILMKNFTDYLTTNNYRFLFIPTNYYLNGRYKAIKSLYYMLIKFIKGIKSCDSIMMNSAFRGAVYVCPLLVLVSKIYRKKFIFRMFGGNFIDIYNNANKLQRILLNIVISHSHISFFETKNIISEIKNKYPNSNVKWFPNVRSKSKLKVNDTYSKKFVYVGHIKKTKGILQLINVFKTLDDSFQLEIYGPIVENDLVDIVKPYYKGSIKPNEVTVVLSKSNVLLLPTFHTGEGYPGIIIEAFSVGMPVIASNWKSLPELVTDNYNGYLIPVKNEDALKHCILQFDNQHYKTFSANAFESFKYFDDQIINPTIYKYCINATAITL